MVTKYQKRISGPLLDRIDIHIEVPRVPYEKLMGERLGESSSIVAARVKAARERQRKRFAAHDSRVVCNADMTPADVRVFCKLDATGQSLVRSAMQQLQLSARAFHRVLKIARTIAPGTSQGLPTWRVVTKLPRHIWPRRYNTDLADRSERPTLIAVPSA